MAVTLKALAPAEGVCAAWLLRRQGILMAVALKASAPAEKAYMAKLPQK